MDLKGIRLEVVEGIRLAQERNKERVFVGMIMKYLIA